MNARTMTALLGLWLAGCAGGLPCRAPQPLADCLPPADVPLLGETAYRLGCADVLEVGFADRPEWDCGASVGLDGRLDLAGAGAPHVEGLTVAEAREVVAGKARQSAARVTLTLADCRAGRVYLTGPENGRQRVVPFRGPEPVMEFLWRAGAMKQGTAELRAVHVVRPNVAAGTRPETFTIDVEAITLDRDHRTNVILRTSDQVVVGETRRSSFSRLLPSWLQPLYHRLAGLLPPEVWHSGPPTPGFTGGMGIPGEAHSP